MQITQSEVNDLQAVLTLVVEPADYEENVKKELRQLRQKANIPGFRKGMVPLDLLKKMYGKSVMADVINKELGVQLSKYIDDNKLNILGEPLPNEELSQKVDFDNDNTFTLAFDIALAPEMNALLTDKDTLTHYTVTVTDEMVNNQVERYQETYGSYADADDVQAGDILKGTLTEQTDNGIVKENGILNPAYIKDEETRNRFLSLKKGDTLVFNPMQAFDSEVEVSSLLDIKKEEVENHKGDFAFVLTGVTRHVKSAIDGELFAKVYGENNIKDEADFRARIRQEIESNMSQDAEYKFGLDAKQAIMDKISSVSLPEAFLRRWVKVTNEKMTDEELDRDFPAMVNELKWHLAKNELVKHFNIEVKKEDVEAYAQEVARMQFMQYGLMHVEENYLNDFAKRMLQDENQVRNIVERVTENKVFEALKGSAKIEEKAISREDFGKLFENNN